MPAGNEQPTPLTMAAKIGLTGGLGSGKSTVAECFAAVGVQVIAADEIGRRLSQPGNSQFDQIVACFGDQILDSSGHIARQQLGEIVFGCAEKRKLLESILHPPIRAEMYARAAQDPQSYCILDIPLLVESAQYRDMHRVAVVSCARAERFQRLQQRRNMRAEQIERIMAQQTSEKNRLAVADDVIDNHGARADLMPQVQKLHATYSALYRQAN